jgi:Domain of unknown function (DUF4760)
MDGTSIIALAISILAIGVSTFTAFWQSRLMRHANLLGALNEIFGEFRTLEFKQHLDFVTTKLRDQYPFERCHIESLPKDATRHVTPVMSFFGAIGTLVANGVVSEVVAASYMGGSTLKAWSKLEPYIRDYRNRHKDETYYGFFEHLAFVAEQYPPSKLQKKLDLKRMGDSSAKPEPSPAET